VPTHPHLQGGQVNEIVLAVVLIVITWFQRLDSQLATASRSFLQQEVNVTQGQQEAAVETSRLLLWYGRDFGSSDRAVIEWLAGALEEDEVGIQLRDALQKGSVKLVFRDYDWGANVGEN